LKKQDQLTFNNPSINAILYAAADPDIKTFIIILLLCFITPYWRQDRTVQLNTTNTSTKNTTK